MYVYTCHALFLLHCVFKPTLPVPMATADNLAANPDPCPATLTPIINTLHSDAKMLMTQARVPWAVMALMAAETDITLQDLAERWLDKNECRDKAAKDLELNTKLNYDDKQAARAARRMSSAVETAQETYNRHRKASITGEPIKITTTDRASMVQIYLSKTHLNLPLEEQGSDNYLAKQKAKIQQGQIGLFTNKEIISALPNYNETVTTKRRRTDSDGITRELDHEEQRYEPQNVEEWKRQMIVFRNTLLMCIWAHPEQSQLQITKSCLDDFYNFLYGPDILQTGPSLTVARIAERNAWREIARQVSSGSTLQASIATVQGNSLFWHRQIYTYTNTQGRLSDSNRDQNRTYGKGYKTKGKGKTMRTKGKGKMTFPRNNYIKGNKGSKGATKGKTPNKSSQQPRTQYDPRTMARENPEGKPYCRDYFNKGCAGGCGRSHSCPILMPSGHPCNGNHFPSPGSCPHLR